MSLPAKGLYRKALPYWVALAIAACVFKVAAGRPQAAGRVGLLTGIEPVTVIKAILMRPNQLGQIMLSLGLPTLARRVGEQDPVFREDLDLPGTFWSLATGVRYHSPQETLRAGIPILGLRPVQPVPSLIVAVKPKIPDRPAKQPQPQTPPSGRDPVQSPPRTSRTVIIFHTHTSESYLPISGRDHLENAAGDIVQVGDYLAKALQAEGFATVHDSAINDQIPFRDAYRRSLLTATQLLAAHPEPLALIDLHRDATPGVVGTVELGGEKVARIALVVGTDRLGLSHPKWRENLAFANSLRDAAERLYPGLLARIDLADARYNQHLFPRAIIIEIGNQYSTAVEVYHAVACLAKILAEVAPLYQPAAPGAATPSETAAPAAAGSTAANPASPPTGSKP